MSATLRGKIAPKRKPGPARAGPAGVTVTLRLGFGAWGGHAGGGARENTGQGAPGPPSSRNRQTVWRRRRWRGWGTPGMGPHRPFSAVPCRAARWPRLMPQASPAVLIALCVRGAAGAFPSAWRNRFHRLPLRAICHVGLSRLSASPKSHFSPSLLPCASPSGRSRGHGVIVRSRVIMMSLPWLAESWLGVKQNEPTIRWAQGFPPLTPTRSFDRASIAATSISNSYTGIARLITSGCLGWSRIGRQPENPAAHPRIAAGRRDGGAAME